MKKNLIALSSIVLGFAPFAALAQMAGNASCTTSTGGIAYSAGTAQYIICRIGNVLDVLIPILVVLGVVYFIWGVVQYVISSEEEAKQAGKMRMIYGIIGLVVIVAMWGLVGIVNNTLGLGVGTSAPAIPQVTF